MVVANYEAVAMLGASLPSSGKPHSQSQAYPKLGQLLVRDQNFVQFYNLDINF
ncbi:hypothetical protein [Nostoc sp. FACHB-110]|uniref:hypothetical protein n=1 Tax=Nostoc sp. FACHB-110 TaxID=2692834 RepID=UPI001681E381|nr:hypothetical protein [Nostoc sp. FACHB-110]MBD2437858.1 hypothetical protein [Nostoc sp. FACHB-110]